MRGDAYGDANHPEHASTVERVNALSMKIFGDGKEGNAPPPYASVPRPSLPPGAEDAWMGDVEDFIRHEGRTAGLSDQQVKHFLDALAKETIDMQREDEASVNAAFHTLRERWGADFERRLGQAREAVRQFDPNLAKLLNETGLGNEPALIEVFAALGESLKERGLMMSEVNDNTSIEDARKEWKRLMASEPYLDSNHRNHQTVVESVNKLAVRVFGEQSASID